MPCLPRPLTQSYYTDNVACEWNPDHATFTADVAIPTSPVGPTDNRQSKGRKLAYDVQPKLQARFH
jgi:hypothetical protein